MNTLLWILVLLCLIDTISMECVFVYRPKNKKTPKKKERKKEEEEI